MKVYLVERGDYEGSEPLGIYATPEVAMQAHPPRPRPDPGQLIGIKKRVYDAATGETRDVEVLPHESRLNFAWEKTNWGWSLDDGSSKSITEYEVRT